MIRGTGRHKKKFGTTKFKGRRKDRDRKWRENKVKGMQIARARRDQEAVAKEIVTDKFDRVVAASTSKDLRKLPTYQEKCLSFRAGKIREWKTGPRSGQCEFRGCQNIPGSYNSEGRRWPQQWDHILARGEYRQFIFAPWNSVISCGCHEYITRVNGVNTTPEQIVEVVRRELPFRLADVVENLLMIGRLDYAIYGSGGGLSTVVADGPQEGTGPCVRAVQEEERGVDDHGDDVHAHERAEAAGRRTCDTFDEPAAP